MPALLTYLTLAAGFVAGWAVRSATLKRQPAPIPLPLRDDRRPR